MPLFWLRRPHVPLLVVLLALVALYPLIEASHPGRWLFNLIVVASTTFSLQRIHAPRGGVFAAAAFGGAALAAQAGHFLLPGHGFGIASALAQVAFYSVAVLHQVRYILRDARATVDELFSAAVAFLLLSFGWASAYWCIEYFVPGSFAVAHPSAASGAAGATWYELFYFSVTTLSTTGFGDIVPVTSPARAATILEQLTGVLYVALIISRLVGFTGRPRPRS